MYLNNLPKFDYDFKKGEYKNINLSVTDLFRRIAFTEDTQKDLRNFVEYVVIDGETPDDVAFKIYGDARWFWVVLLSNNIVDVENEWPQSQNKIQRRFDDNGFYKEDRGYQKGDVIVKIKDCVEGAEGCPDGVSAEVGNYGVIDSFDKEFMRLNVKKKGPDYNLTYGTRVAIVREIVGADQSTFPLIMAATGCGYEDGVASQWMNIRKVTSIADGVAEFRYGSETISPYTIATGGGPIDGGPPGATEVPHGTSASYQGLCDTYYGGDQKTPMLYKYIHQEDLPAGFKAISFEEKMFEDQFRKRKIKLIHPSLLGRIYDEFKLLMNSNVARGTTSVIEIS